MGLIRTLDELDELEKLSLIDISYSRLDTYESCRAKYFYTYIQQEDRDFGGAAALGNVVHGVLETVVGEEPYDLGEMLMLMEEQREIYDPAHEISVELMDVGVHLLTEWIDRHGDERPDIIGKELPIKLVIGSALITGYIDRVERDPDGTIRIVDYKTGKWEWRGDPINNLQLGIYALAASYYFPGSRIYAELYYLRSGKRKGALFLPGDLERVYDDVLDRVNDLIEDQNFTQTTDRNACRICDFGKNGICPGPKPKQ